VEEDVEGVLGGAQEFLSGFPFGVLKEEGAVGTELGLIAAGVGFDIEPGAEEGGVVGADALAPVESVRPHFDGTEVDGGELGDAGEGAVLADVEVAEKFQSFVGFVGEGEKGKAEG